MKTYLSEQKLKGLKSFLDQQIPKATIEVLKKLTSEGLDLFESTAKNREQMWHYYNDKVRGLNNKASEDFLRFAARGSFYEMGDIVKGYIEKNHKRENEIIANFSPDGINHYIYGIDMIWQKNHLCDDNFFNVKDLVYVESFDIYIDNKFSIKNVDKELLKQADKIANDIDAVYMPKVRSEDSYNKYIAAQKEYFLTGDRQKLFNLLNKDY